MYIVLTHKQPEDWKTPLSKSKVKSNQNLRKLEAKSDHILRRFKPKRERHPTRHETTHGLSSRGTRALS